MEREDKEQQHMFIHTHTCMHTLMRHMHCLKGANIKKSYFCHMLFQLSHFYLPKYTESFNPHKSLHTKI